MVAKRRNVCGTFWIQNIVPQGTGAESEELRYLEIEIAE